MVKPCTHFNPSLSEKDFFKGLESFYSLTCTLSNSHQKEEQELTKMDLWLCLECYETGCGRSRADKCMMKHSEEKKHHVSLNPA